MVHFYLNRGRSIEERALEFGEWVRSRIHRGLWPYQLTWLYRNGVRGRVADMAGNEYEGIDFSTCDYLGLASHPALLDTARAALVDFGLQCGSSGPIAGNNRSSRHLESTLGEFLDRRHVLLFPSGWSACCGAVSGLLRAGDVVLMDELAHQSLQQGAAASTSRVFRFRHLDNAGLEARLADLRRTEPKTSIVVVTEGLFSMDSTGPELEKLVGIAKSYEAMVIVDVSHDLTVLGRGGRSRVATLQRPESVDLVVGSLSKSLATTGGFIATNSWDTYITIGAFAGPYTFAAPMSPVSAAVAEHAIRIAASDEGESRRKRLFDLVERFREEAGARGLECGGGPSPILPVLVGKEEVTRRAARRALQSGLICPALEMPVVPHGAARFRLSMTPNHGEQDILEALDIIRDSIEWAKGV